MNLLCLEQSLTGCVQLTKLNDCVKQEFLLLTIDTILHKLSGSSIHATEAAGRVWQIDLSTNFEFQELSVVEAKQA